jgi:hypothetical protein
MIANSAEDIDTPHKPHRFSKNVLALTMFFPIALAFHAQKDPEGSTWYKLGPRLMSHPATSNDTPKGRTPLNKRIKNTRDLLYI